MAAWGTHIVQGRWQLRLRESALLPGSRTDNKRWGQKNTHTYARTHAKQQSKDGFNQRKQEFSATFVHGF